MIGSTAVTVSYSSALTSNSPKYRRPGQTTANYYYQAILLNVSNTATYTFQSTSNIDLYAYLYANSFDASNSSSNLIKADDDSGGNLQFILKNSLAVRRIYILVVTTYNRNVLGSFTIKGSSNTNNAKVSFSLIPTPIKTTTITTATTSSIRRTPVTLTEGQ